VACAVCGGAVGSLRDEQISAGMRIGQERTAVVSISVFARRARITRHVHQSGARITRHVHQSGARITQFRDASHGETAKIE
jgi:hypothetical protein